MFKISACCQKKTTTVQWREKLNIQELHQCALCVTRTRSILHKSYNALKKIVQKLQEKYLFAKWTHPQGCTIALVGTPGIVYRGFYVTSTWSEIVKVLPEVPFRTFGRFVVARLFCTNSCTICLSCQCTVSVQRVHALCQEWYASSCIVFKICPNWRMVYER